MGSGAPNPRDAVQQLQHLRGPKAGPALGWAHRGSGCSSLGARGISCEMLRPSSSTLHQPIHAAKIPPLGTSTFQPPPTGTGLCWTTHQPLLAQFQQNTCHTVGPGTAGPEPGTWVLSTPALCPQSCCVQPGPPANPAQECSSSLEKCFWRCDQDSQCKWPETIGYSQSTGAGFILSCLNVWVLLSAISSRRKRKKKVPKGEGGRSVRNGCDL